MVAEILRPSATCNDEIYKALIVWSWPTISLQTPQHDNIVALIWNNSIVVLRQRDSETDQLHVYKVLKIIWADLCANIKWINVNTFSWSMCTCTMCATPPSAIITSPIGKTTVKPDHWRRYRHVVTDFHTMSWYKTSHNSSPRDISLCCPERIRKHVCVCVCCLQLWTLEGKDDDAEAAPGN